MPFRVGGGDWFGRSGFASNAELAARLDQLEQKYDGQFRAVFEAIRQLMVPVVPNSVRIGFEVEN